ncbi:MAG TPA: hypothetical protein VM840_10680 [Actinomycetota bacterium]|nr:hypothetical protein [Actinomycetota bacterium]
MPYVPTPSETVRLRHAIDAASFREGERIAWLAAFVSLVALDVVLGLTGASWPGVVGSVFGFLILYWRLRGGHLAREASGPGSELFGLGLRTHDQRAFTGLMLRHALTGRNPLEARVEHDPFSAWRRVTTGVAADESGES